MQTTLIKTALSLSKDAGLRVHGVTFDGTATNLGCNMVGKYDQIKSSFEFEGRTYYVILDVCHMIKLARNCLGGLKEIRSSDGIISWEYLKRLYELQSSIGLKFANKLSKSHLEWTQNKMKVKFATQTLSASTAGALEFLKNTGHDKFQGAEETIKFIRYKLRVKNYEISIFS